MPRQQPNDNQQRVIIRGKTRTVGSPPARLERPAPNPERGMPRSESDGARVAVAASRRGAEAPPLRPGERAPAVPPGERKGRGFPDRIAALEEGFDDLQAFRSDAAKVLSDLCQFREDNEELIKDLVSFKDDVTVALKEYAGRVGALEAFQQILVPVLEAHGITFDALAEGAISHDLQAFNTEPSPPLPPSPEAEAPPPTPPGEGDKADGSQ